MEWRLEIFFPTKKECSDWRESLTFKQALYPYRVGKDMHNPSKMHMNFPSSNSSRLNSSQWINYEYCMHRSVGDQIEFTVKRKTKNKPLIWEYPPARKKNGSLKCCFCANCEKKEKRFQKKSRLLQPLSWTGKMGVNFHPLFDWVDLPASCTTWRPQVSGWCSVAWNKQIEKGTSWHSAPTKTWLTARPRQ